MSKKRWNKTQNVAGQEKGGGLSRRTKVMMQLGLLVGVVALAVVAFNLGQGSGASYEAPEPWQYDEAQDRYWHPGHGHWHSGPPPAEEERAAEETGMPEPWHYDEEADQHWDPGHGHWHQGPPPPAEQR